MDSEKNTCTGGVNRFNEILSSTLKDNKWGKPEGQVLYQYMNSAHPTQYMNPRLFQGGTGTRYVLPQHLSQRVFNQQQTGLSNHTSLNIHRSDPLSGKPTMIRGSVCSLNSSRVERHNASPTLLSTATPVNELNLPIMGLPNTDGDARRYSSSGVPRPSQQDSWQFQMYQQMGFLEQQQQQQQKQQQGISHAPPFASSQLLGGLSCPLLQPNAGCGMEEIGRDSATNTSVVNNGTTNNNNNMYQTNGSHSVYLPYSDSQMMLMHNAGVALPVLSRPTMNAMDTNVIPMNRASALASPHSKRLVTAVPTKNNIRLQQIKKPISGIHPSANQNVHPLQQYMLVPLSPSSPSPSKTAQRQEVAGTSLDVAQIQHHVSRSLDSGNHSFINGPPKSKVDPQSSNFHVQQQRVASGLPSHAKMVPSSPSQAPLESHKVQGMSTDGSLLRCLRLPSDNIMDSSERAMSNTSSWSFPLSPITSFQQTTIPQMPQLPTSSDPLVRPEATQTTLPTVASRGGSPNHSSNSSIVKTPTHNAGGPDLGDFQCGNTLRSAMSPVPPPSSSSSSSSNSSVPTISSATAIRTTRPPTADSTCNFVKRFLLSSPLNVPQGVISGSTASKNTASLSPGQPTTVSSVDSRGGNMLRSPSSHDPALRPVSIFSQQPPLVNLTVENASGWVSHVPIQLSPLPFSEVNKLPIFLLNQEGNKPTLSSWLQNPKQQHQQIALGSVLHSDSSMPRKLDSNNSYTECFLRGLATVDRVESIIAKLSSVLTGLSGTQPVGGVWKTECWRATFDPDALGPISGRLVQGSSGFNCELWVRRYAEPSHLRAFHCLRMYSSEHVVAPNAPVNARRVMEAAVTPQFLKLLPYMGFRKSATNDVFVSALLFHHSVQGAKSALLISIQKHYKDEKLLIDLFPGKYVVEVTGREEDDKMIEPLFQRILDLCHHIQPFVYFTKM